MRVLQVFLFSVICIIGCRCQCDLSNFKKSKIVPNIIPDLPEKPLEVIFFNQSFECGTNTGYLYSLKAPTVHYDADKGTTFTIIMIDADFFLPDANLSATYLHLLIVNIPGNNVNEGKTISPYFIPLPFPLSGNHRYIILVYEQVEKIDPSEKSPPLVGFDINAYVKSHNLQGPRFGYYFIVGSSAKEVWEKFRSYFKL